MGVRPWWLPAAVLAASLAGETAFACQTCKQTPCVLAPAPAPAPAFECVTEMVPCTVMKTKTKVDLVPAYSKTVMKMKFETEYDVQTKLVCKQIFDTVFETRCVTVCRPVCETTLECQRYRACRPVTTTRQVTDYCTKPYTELVTIPVKDKCSRCGHFGGGCTCKTVARTCYKRVPVVREVTETHMVSEVRSQLVPVVHWRLVPEQRIERVPVTVCRMVNDVVTIRVPRLVVKYEPKTLVYKKAVLTCEEIPVTVYRPVVKMVPVVGPSPQCAPGGLDSAGVQVEVLPVPPDSRPAAEKKDAVKIPAEPEKPRSPFAPASPARGGGAGASSAKPPMDAK
jgi:hypothetical protein